MFMILLMIILFMGMLLSFLGWFLSNKMFMSKETLNPFECGFDNDPSYRFPLSLRFFILTIMFLLFDMEMVLLLPLPPSMNLFQNFYVVMSVTMFMMMLFVGMFLEWEQGSLDWN